MSDLTVDEQKNVRTALLFLRSRMGRWGNVAKALDLAENTMTQVMSGRRIVTPLVAFRVAKLAKVGVNDVLAGRFPIPGACPHCGRGPEPDG